jgi:hypothetical protein
MADALTAAWLTASWASDDALDASDEALSAVYDASGRADFLSEKLGQSLLLRDILGPLLFRSIALVPSWLSSTVTYLAESIYTNRAFDRLPILADALEEAGCDNADILNHCRQSGEHVRGCWVVDLLLGKS